MLTPGSVVLATAYSDPAKPKGTGKDEAVIWVNHYGKGRVFKNVLGHDTKAMADKNVQEWMRRGVEWAATGQVASEREVTSTVERGRLPDRRSPRPGSGPGIPASRSPDAGHGDAPVGTARLQRRPADPARPRTVRRAVRGRAGRGRAVAPRARSARTRRLGRNPDNGAVAVLAVHRGRALVADPPGGVLPDRPDLAPVRPPPGRVRPPRRPPQVGPAPPPPGRSPEGGLSRT